MDIYNYIVSPSSIIIIPAAFVDAMEVFWIFVLMNFLFVKVVPNINANGVSPFERNILEGRHFVIGIHDIPPYVLIHRDAVRNITVDGFIHRIILWMAEKYKFTFKYVEPPDEAFGAFVNGSWNGLVGMAVRNEIDLVATALSITYPRSKVVDFTFSFTDDPMALLIPFPRLDSTISGIIKPFEYEVWIGIIVSLLVVSVILWFISKIESQGPFQISLFSQFWFLFRVVASPDDIIHYTLATRLVVAAWCLISIVVVNSYTSSLVSHLMAPKFSPLINTVQDLADSREISIVVLKHTSVDSALFAATSGSFLKLGDSLRSHPENNLQSMEGIEDIVYYQRKAYPYQHTSLKQLIYDDFKVTKQCRLSIAKEHLFPDQLAFAMPKKSSLTEIYNIEIIWLRQLGLLNHWTDSFLPRPYRCSAPLSSLRPTSNEKLTINYLSSAFLLFGVGVVVSFLAFVFELISSKLWYF